MMLAVQRLKGAAIWRGFVALLIIVPLLTIGPIARQSVTAAPLSPRHLNVWPTTGSVNWANASIFWFGKATENDNYVDVRVAYDSQNLYVFATIVDYYLWFDPTGAADPRTYDALAVYLNTAGVRATAPQATDYFFVSGFRVGTTASSLYQRQGQGSGSGWNENWSPSPAWSDNVAGRWYTSGPNNNSDRDAGWATTLTIPWATLGRSGPPAAGATWGLGTILYDRDNQPPNGTVPNEYWPEAMDPSTPATWGQIAFNPANYQPPASRNDQTIVIRRGLNANFVQDAYAGGGGTCGGGIFGGGDVPHPTDNLFVQNEADVSDFPCFSKSYLKFDLSAIPAGKVIQSAKLTIYQFGGSNSQNAPTSDVQVFSVQDPWDETTLTWNNAPLATENYPGASVAPMTTPLVWPGIPITWDVTPIVADAYQAGQPASLALYSADTGYNSGKYFVSSDAQDWDANGRPTLTITYGDHVVFLANVSH